MNLILGIKEVALFRLFVIFGHFYLFLVIGYILACVSHLPDDGTQIVLMPTIRMCVLPSSANVHHQDGCLA